MEKMKGFHFDFKCSNICHFSFHEMRLREEESMREEKNYENQLETRVEFPIKGD